MLTHLKEELDKFRKRIITEARKNLTRQKKKASGSLYKNLDSELEVYRSGNFMLSFELGSYGEFVDKGVKGKNPSKVSKNARIKGQQAPNSPFRFGSGSTKNYKGFVNSLEKWISRKRLRLRDEKGRYKKGSYKTLAHIIAGNIYNRGLKPSLYFTRPFNNEFKKLSDDLVEAFGLDIDEFLKYTLNKYE